MSIVKIVKIDPLEFIRDSKSIGSLCADKLARARAIREEIKACSNEDALSYEKVLGRFDDMVFEVGLASGMTGLMAVAHDDVGARNTAKDCQKKIDEFYTDLMLDAELARVIFSFDDSKPKLDSTRQRLLRDLVRDFRRNGLDLPADKQTRLRAINQQLTKLELDFETNLSEATLAIEVDASKLGGLPESFLASHPAGDDGKVRITTDYPDYFPVATYCDDRDVAFELARLFNNRAADENVPILERVLVLRHEKARLLGYETWADYAVEPRMAKTPSEVKKFLTDASQRVREPAKREYAEFAEEHARHGGDPSKRLPLQDRLYLQQLLGKRKYGFDSKVLSEYFEVESVLSGLLQIVSTLYTVEIRTNTTAPNWNDDVRVIDLFEHDSFVGRVYLDLYPREGKFKHAAMFSLRAGKRLPNGDYVEPIAALVTNFPKPGDTAALLTHEQVTTLFHEFGHTLHHVLSKEELTSYSGTSTVRDFVETPSQMFEEWAWKRETLDVFAKHHETGKTIPDDLFRAMTAARSFGRALGTERQIALSLLDFEYHSKTPPMDTDAVLTEIMEAAQSFAPLPDTHFQATFGHLMGYDAAYYGYQWALAIARDVLTRFEAEGYMNPETAASWRQTVLARGAGADESALVREFLGRDWNLDAYSEFLAGQ